MASQAFVTLEYDRLAIESEDISLLEDELRPDGPTRSRIVHKDRGGDFTVLWVVITYVGLRYLDGVIGAIAGKHLEQLTRALNRVFRRQAVAELPNACLKLSYDEFDLVVNIPRDATPDYCNAIAMKVAEHFPAETIAQEEIRAIVVPVVFGDDQWEELAEWTLTSDSDRYWGIGEHNSSAPVTVYDSVTRRRYDWFEKP